MTVRELGPASQHWESVSTTMPWKDIVGATVDLEVVVSNVEFPPYWIARMAPTMFPELCVQRGCRCYYGALLARTSPPPGRSFVPNNASLVLSYKDGVVQDNLREGDRAYITGKVVAITGFDIAKAPYPGVFIAVQRARKL